MKKAARQKDDREVDPLEELRGKVQFTKYPVPDSLVQIYLWQQRIEKRLDENRPATEFEHWLFRPCELADRDRTRLSVKFPLPFKRVDELLDYVNATFKQFMDGSASQDDLFVGMGSLADKIQTAIEIVSTEVNKPKWSRHRSVADWVKVLTQLGYHMSDDTFGRRRKATNGPRYRENPDSTRSAISLWIDDLPPNYTDDLIV